MAKKIKKAAAKEKKIFVLDTSVIIYDHTAIKNFVNSFNLKNKRIFFTFGAFSNQKIGGILRQMYNLLSLSSKTNENISTSFKLHRNEFLKMNANEYNNSLFFISIPELLLVFINLIYDFFHKIFFYKAIFYETLFYNLFKFSKKTKVILTIHDLIDEKYYNKNTKFYIKLKTNFKLFFKKISIKNSDRIICVSNNTKKDFLSYYGKCISKNKIKVINPGYFNKFLLNDFTKTKIKPTKQERRKQW